MELENDTAVNVAALLREQVGTTREYPVRLSTFVLDDDLIVTGIEGKVRLTRLSDEVLARIEAAGFTTLACWRCLREYEQELKTVFEEEFRAAFDIRTGTGIAGLVDDERFEINDAHELDFGESLRQELIIAMPMRPICGDDCPGPAAIATGETEPELDSRFAALANLIDEVSTNGR